MGYYGGKQDISNSLVIKRGTRGRLFLIFDGWG